MRRLNAGVIMAHVVYDQAPRSATRYLLVEWVQQELDTMLRTRVRDPDAPVNDERVRVERSTAVAVHTRMLRRSECGCYWWWCGLWISPEMRKPREGKSRGYCVREVQTLRSRQIITIRDRKCSSSFLLSVSYKATTGLFLCLSLFAIK